MCCWWRKVRKANISEERRTQLERFGENVVAQGLANPEIGTYTGEFAALISRHYDDAIAWLTERRDLHERREDRLETVEIAVLIFVILGVIVESGLDKLIWHLLSRL